MPTKYLTGLLLAATMASPALAQTTDASTGRTPAELYQRGYNSATTAGQAPDPASAAEVAGLNAQAGAASERHIVRDAAAQAQYEADRASYIDALVKHDAAVDRTDARYMRQQNAYADAMSVWRVQVSECKRGHHKACDMPPPNVADFY